MAMVATGCEWVWTLGLDLGWDETAGARKRRPWVQLAQGTAGTGNSWCWEQLVLGRTEKGKFMIVNEIF